MLSQDVLNKIENIAAQATELEGCLLYDIEFVGGASGRTLRVVIDKMEVPVGIEDCTNVTRRLNDITELDELIPGGAYNLEVSSPGLERTLKKPSHFKTVVGKRIWLKLSQDLGSLGAQDPKIKNTKQMTESLKSVGEAQIELEINNELIKIPFTVIEKAKLVFELDKGEKKGMKQKNQKR